MKIRQREVWKAKSPGFEQDHWFVVLSGQERLDSQKAGQINALACFTLRGELLSTDVRLNGADGFSAPTACQCDLVWFLNKSMLHSKLGEVCGERQRVIKSKLKEVLRL